VVTLAVPMLRPDQARIAHHPAKRKYVAMGRRWGKSMMCLIIIIGALRQGMRVAWVVPNYRNSNGLWRAVEGILGVLVKNGQARINRSERTVRLMNGGMLGVYTADNPTGMRGEWFHLVIVDEASRVAEEVIDDVIEPTLADADGDAIYISTPAGKNWFWRGWQNAHADMRQCAAFSAPTSANPSPMIRKAAEMARLRFGEDSDTYKQEWLAEFVDSGALVWLAEWVKRYDPDEPTYQNRIIGRTLSYDTASKDKNTNAYSVCVVGDLMDDYSMCIRHVWRERLLMPQLVERIAEDAKRWNYDGKLFDRDGIRRGDIVIEDQSSGTGAYQMLYHTGDPLLQACLSGFRPTNSKEERFGNTGIWVKRGWVKFPVPSGRVPWLHAFESELFQEEDFMDQRDAVAQLILWNEPTFYRGVEARGRVEAA
jgi:predicted phage terminase large subunit-like protein